MCYIDKEQAGHDNFRNLPCIHTRYILSCRFRLTMRRLSTPSCSVANFGGEGGWGVSNRFGWILVGLTDREFDEGVTGVNSCRGCVSVVLTEGA